MHEIEYAIKKLKEPVMENVKLREQKLERSISRYQNKYIPKLLRADTVILRMNIYS